MELTSRMKITRFQTFWIQMRKNKPLDESCKTGQTSPQDENGILLCIYLCLFLFQNIPLLSFFLWQHAKQ
ncbi:hypothetical protein Hanom_Chr08g00705071 [Helianthus anomalus]